MAGRVFQSFFFWALSEVAPISGNFRRVFCRARELDRMGSEARFAAYVEQLGTALGHADRQEPLHDYCLGLLMPIERKSVEPMAAVTALWAFSPRA